MEKKQFRDDDDIDRFECENFSSTTCECHKIGACKNWEKYKRLRDEKLMMDARRKKNVSEK